MKVCSTDQMKEHRQRSSTDYNSLYPRHVLLREQMLLQPLQVIVGAVHMVLSSPRQLTHTEQTASQEVCSYNYIFIFT